MATYQVHARRSLSAYVSSYHPLMSIQPPFVINKTIKRVMMSTHSTLVEMKAALFAGLLPQIHRSGRNSEIKPTSATHGHQVVLQCQPTSKERFIIIVWAHNMVMSTHSTLVEMKAALIQPVFAGLLPHQIRPKFRN